MATEIVVRVRYLGGVFHVKLPGKPDVTYFQMPEMRQHFGWQITISIKRARGEWTFAPMSYVKWVERVRG